MHWHSNHMFIAFAVIIIACFCICVWYEKSTETRNYNAVPVPRKSVSDKLHNNVLQGVRKFYYEHGDMFQKLQIFNEDIDKYIDEQLGRSQQDLNCSTVYVDLNKPDTLVRGFVNNSWHLLHSSKRFVGTPSWYKDNSWDISQLAKVPVNKRQRRIKHVLKDQYLYNTFHSSPEVTTLVLSALPQPNASVINVTTAIKNYFQCYITPRTKAEKSYSYRTDNAKPADCVKQCSSNLRVLSTPIELPDHYLQQDYTSGIFCEKGLKYESELSRYAMYSLHNSNTGDFMTSLDVVPGGGAVSNIGQIRTQNNSVLELFHTYYGLRKEGRIRDFQRANKLSTCSREVFTIADYYSFNYYHKMYEQLPRLGGYVDFLRKRPEIDIHVAGGAEEFYARILPIFGLKNRLVSGAIRAARIYRPHGPGRSNPPILHLQATHNLFRQHIKHLLSTSNNGFSEKRKIILIKRTLRFFVNYNDIYSHLRDLAEKSNRELYIFDDQKLPSFNETMTLFYHADVIMAPHGAGLSNIMFSQAGATVIEVYCRGKKTSLCFRHMSLHLGMRYVAMETTRKRSSIRCNDDGVIVDIAGLSDVLHALVMNVLSTD